MTSPLSLFRFRIVWLCSWLIWMAMHSLVLYRFGFSWSTAIWDSLISNVTLALASILILVILQFYLPKKNQYGFILGLCAVLTAAWFLVSRSLIVLMLTKATDYRSFFTESVLIRLAFGFLVTGCMALVSVLWFTLRDHQEAEKRKSEAVQLSKEAELVKLRQQLQPHFLFNSLNSINALIGIKPNEARKMIQQLSDFLRGTLKKEDRQWTSFDEELAHLQLYLDIEKVRFGHRLSTEISTPHQPARVPSMLLQPVVENAIKFGLYDTTGEILIRIHTFLKEDILHIEVSNPFDPETTRSGTGFGLKSVQRRLYLLFGRHDLLEASVAENIFTTTIKIPQHYDQGDHH